MTLVEAGGPSDPASDYYIPFSKKSLSGSEGSGLQCNDCLCNFGDLKKVKATGEHDIKFFSLVDQYFYK